MKHGQAGRRLDTKRANVKKLVRKIFSLLGLAVSRAPAKGAPVCWPSSGPIPQTYFETDREFHDQYDLAQQKTQMLSSDNALRRNRHYFLYHLIRQAPIRSGHVVELGCWKGLSAFQIANYLSQNRTDFGQRKFFIFDSFEGLSEINAVDRPQVVTQSKSADEELRLRFATPLDVVRANLSCFSDLVVYFEGWIPERFHEVKNETFSFVHVDVDLYEPIKASIEFFYPRLAKHGIMVFDDYGCVQFPGARRAVDEFLPNTHDCIFVPTPTGSAFLVKLMDSICH